MWCKFFDCLFSCVIVRNKEFEKYDLNNDGRISLDEYHAMHISKYGSPPTLKQWIAFHLADENHNGYITKAEVEAFEKHNNII